MRAKKKEYPPKDVAAFLATPVCEVNGRGLGKEGELYGVELEVEGRNVSMEGKAVKGWQQVAEGSLRGECIEYIFSTPCKYEEAIARVTRLFDAFDKTGVVLKNSYRCSTHVHLNFASQPIKHVTNFFVLYTVLEQLLEEYCGEMRRGNVFCLSSRDVELIVDFLEESLLARFDLGKFGDNQRYCGVNLSALNKFGTIELRTMRGADNSQMVIDWLKILHNLWEFSRDMDSPAKLLERMSLLGTDQWLREIFTEENYANVMASWPMDKNLQASLYEGARLVQVLAYKLEEAYQIPDAAPRKKKAAGFARPERYIRNPTGRLYYIPVEYVDGTRVHGIEPERIVYSAIDDAWYQVINERGNPLPIAVRCRWDIDPEEEEFEEDLDEEDEEWIDED